MEGPHWRKLSQDEAAGDAPPTTEYQSSNLDRGSSASWRRSTEPAQDNTLTARKTDPRRLPDTDGSRAGPEKAMSSANWRTSTDFETPRTPSAESRPWKPDARTIFDRTNEPQSKLCRVAGQLYRPVQNVKIHDLGSAHPSVEDLVAPSHWGAGGPSVFNATVVHRIFKVDRLDREIAARLSRVLSSLYTATFQSRTDSVLDEE